jgi:uncharacterized membrane protein YfcA
MMTVWNSVWENISLLQLGLLWVVVIFAALIRAFSGFGFALAAMPVFSLLMQPTQAVVLTVALSLFVNTITIPKFWGVYPARPLTPMILLSLVGTGIGAMIVGLVSVQQFQLIIGVGVIFACATLTLYKPRHRQPNPRLAAGVGAISGLLNGAMAIPGPPVIIFAMATEPDPARSRSLLMTYFLFSALLALIAYGIAGYIDLVTVVFFAIALPAMLAGDKLGFWLFDHYGNAAYRRIALGLLYIIGVAITLKALADA